MSIDKRKHHRTPINMGSLPSAIMTLYKPFFRDPFRVTVLDLSAGGMKILSPEILPLYFEFGLDFSLPGISAIHAKGKALHQTKNDNTYDIGIGFTELNQEVQSELLIMGEDYGACELRIKKELKEVCLPTCSFIKLCQKEQKIKQ